MLVNSNLKVEDIKTSAESKRCAVQKALFYVQNFLDELMCGKCFPCSLGIYEAKIRLQKIMERRGTTKDISVLRRIAENMRVSSRCKKGKDSASFILEWMGTGFFQEHLNGVCTERECLAFIEFVIVPPKCIMCGLCQDVCKHHAIFGEKSKPYLSGYLPFEIRQKRCVKCGECVNVCPTDAIVVLSEKNVASI